MSSSQGVFELVIEDYGFAAVLSFWDKAAIVILNISMWATKGLQPPDIIGSVSSGLDIDVFGLITSWLPTTIFYGAIAYLLGVWMLKQKELDKVQT